MPQYANTGPSARNVDAPPMVTTTTRHPPSQHPTIPPMKPSLLPLFASLLSATSLLAQDPGHHPTAPEPPQPPQPPPHLSGPGERAPHQQALPPADAPRPQQRRRPNAPQPAPAISPRAISNIEQMARAKEAEGHPDEAMELRQLIGSLRSPQGRRPNLRPQPPQPSPAGPNGPGMTAPSRPNADFHQKLESLQHQLMALRNELNALRHQTAPHAAPPHSPETLKRIAKARLENPRGPLADKDGSAIRKLLEKRLSELGKPKKLKELRKDSPDVKEQRKSKKKAEPKDAPKHDAPKEPEADSHKKDADHKEADHHKDDDHKEEPKADNHDDDHKEEHKGGEKEEEHKED